MSHLSTNFKQERIINFLFFNLITYFVLILPFFLNSIAIYRFDYAVYTIPIYLIFIFGSGLIVKLFSGKILKIIFDNDKNFKRGGLLCIFIINSILSVVLFLLYIENRIYWASDSTMMAIYLLIFFIFEYLLLLIILNSGINISSLSDKSVIIGAIFAVFTYLIMIFNSSFIYLSLIVLYLISNILITYPKEYKFIKKKVRESTLQDSELNIDFYIKNRKTKYLLAFIKYFTFFLCALLISINSLRIFYDLNIWAIHFLVFSVSFFLVLYISLIFYRKRIIRNEEIILMVVIIISFIETVLLLIFPIEMTFKVALLVFVFNIIHGATLSLLVFYIIIIIKNLTKSNFKSKINKDIFIHIYSFMWLLAAILVYLGFGYLLVEVEWLNPNYILFSIALILIIINTGLLKVKNKLRKRNSA